MISEFVPGTVWHTNVGTPAPLRVFSRIGDRVDFVFDDDDSPAGHLIVRPLEDIVIVGAGLVVVGPCVYCLKETNYVE